MKRGELGGDEPLHVTLRVFGGLAPLRCPEAHAVLCGALKRYGERGSFRVVQYTLMDDHVHLVVEAGSREALSSGMNSLMTSLAKQWNKRYWRRRGQVFADRFHARMLRTPTEVRNALRYVFTNAHHHGYAHGRGEPDPFSSALLRWVPGLRRAPAATSLAPRGDDVALAEGLGSCRTLGTRRAMSPTMPHYQVKKPRPASPRPSLSPSAPSQLAWG